jgi:hypothetical protein
MAFFGAGAMSGQVHYEVYSRKTALSGWALVQACESKQQAIDTAEDLLRDKHAIGVKVTKETLDPGTMRFDSIVVMTRGDTQVQRPKAVQEELAPRCLAPDDLYAPHAREVLGTVLEDWLRRQSVTAWELLHRPDLAERLEASGVELQHAIQRVAVPDSQSSGQPVHEVVRHYQKLADQTLERVIGAGRKGLFPDLANRSLAEVADRLATAPDRAFVIGGTIAGALVGLRLQDERLERLMDLADRAPAAGPGRALVMGAIEDILSEMLASRAILAQILGPDLDLGASLAAAVRMVAPREIDMLLKADARFAAQMPEISGPASRLAARLAAGEFSRLSTALVRMVVRELTGARRLRPSNARGEIDVLRALAMGLTATAGRLITLEEIQIAFTERSKALVTADFVTAFVSHCDTALCEAEHLTRLCENVTGGANKRAAARWLAACVGSLKFETEMRNGLSAGTAMQRLGILAKLARSVAAAALGEIDQAQITAAIGTVAAGLEAETRLVAQLGRSPAPMPHKLSALLKLAVGEAGPPGAVAERAKAEVVRLYRAPETRAALAADPAAMPMLQPMLRAAGIAA